MPNEYETSFDDLMDNTLSKEGNSITYPKPSVGYPYDQPNTGLPQISKNQNGEVTQITAPPAYVPTSNQPVNIVYNFDMSTKTVVNNISVKKTNNSVSMAVGDAVLGALGGAIGKLID